MTEAQYEHAWRRGYDAYRSGDPQVPPPWAGEMLATWLKAWESARYFDEKWGDDCANS